jgi:hypothetical protein
MSLLFGRKSKENIWKTDLDKDFVYRVVINCAHPYPHIGPPTIDDLRLFYFKYLPLLLYGVRAKKFHHLSKEQMKELGVPTIWQHDPKKLLTCVVNKQTFAYVPESSHNITILWLQLVVVFKFHNWTWKEYKIEEENSCLVILINKTSYTISFDIGT